MNPGIFLIQENGDLVEMIETPPISEALLQTWLEKYPSLLAGYQIDPSAPRRWLLVERECGVPSEEGGGGRWSADHLFLDQDAIPTIVEVKRSANTQIRREIVGQMLDYAANAVVYWPVERIRERFAKTHGLVADEKLEDFLDGRMEVEDFWQLANENLKKKKVRLLFVADEIPTELQRIVEFLNEQMNPTEVLAVEIKQFVGGAQTGLVPRVIGRTARGETVKDHSTPAPINENTFFETLAGSCSTEEIEVAKQILKWSEKNASYVKWRSRSFAPYFESDSNHAYIPTGVSVDGTVGVNFMRLKKRNGISEETRTEILRRLNEIPGVNLPPESINDKKHGIPLSTLAKERALEQFLNVITWVVETDQVRSHQETDLMERA
jgi:hypothetical protein